MTQTAQNLPEPVDRPFLTERTHAQRMFRPFSPDKSLYKPPQTPDITLHQPTVPPRALLVPSVHYETSLDDLTTLEYRKFCKQFFKEVFMVPRMSLEDMQPELYLASYRIIRHMANALGLIENDELLTILDTPDPNNHQATHWTSPVPTPNIPRNTSHVVRQIMQCQPHLPLLPPAPPQEAYYQGTMQLHPDYDPLKDEDLVEWCLRVQHIGQHLNLDTFGNADDPESGPRAMKVLTSPLYARIAVPAPSQLIVFEELILDEGRKVLVDQGNSAAARMLTDRFGFTRAEVLRTLKLVRSFAHNAFTAEVEQERAIMVLKLEEVVHRAREALDIRAELQALKAISVIQGLAPTGEDNTLKDIIEAARAYSAAQKSANGDLEEIPAHVRENLPPRPTGMIEGRVLASD